MGCKPNLDEIESLEFNDSTFSVFFSTDLPKNTIYVCWKQRNSEQIYYGQTIRDKEGNIIFPENLQEERFSHRDREIIPFFIVTPTPNYPKEELFGILQRIQKQKNLIWN